MLEKSFPLSVRPTLRDIWAKFRYHNPLCVRLWHKFPTNCDAHLTESIFKACFGSYAGRAGEEDTCAKQAAARRFLYIVNTSAPEARALDTLLSVNRIS